MLTCYTRPLVTHYITHCYKEQVIIFYVCYVSFQPSADRNICFVRKNICPEWSHHFFYFFLSFPRSTYLNTGIPVFNLGLNWALCSVVRFRSHVQLAHHLINLLQPLCLQEPVKIFHYTLPFQYNLNFSFCYSSKHCQNLLGKDVPVVLIGRFVLCFAIPIHSSSGQASCCPLSMNHTYTFTIYSLIYISISKDFDSLQRLYLGML